MPTLPRSVVQVLDNSENVLKALKLLGNRRVLVGVVGQTADRQEAGQPTNATLAYIHEHGAPEANIPARPFLKPGVKSVQAETTAGLRKAGQLALAGKTTQVENTLHAVGMRAANAVKRKITEGPFVPLAEATILGRLRRTQRGRSRLKSMRKKGVDITAWGQANMKPLLDTGQLRQSITYAIQRPDGGRTQGHQ